MELPVCGPIGPNTDLHITITAYNVHLAIRKDLADASRNAMARDLQVAGQILGMNRAIGSLSHTDLEQLVAHLQATSSPATAARRGATVNGFLRWAAQQNNALPHGLLVSIPRPTRLPPAVLSRDQVARLLEFTAEMKDPLPAFLVRLVLTTGMKKHEVVALQIQHLILDANPPYIVVQGKGRKRHKQRNILVPAALRRFYQAYDEQYNPIEQVFPLSTRSLYYIMEDLAQTLKMPVNFTALRWTAALHNLQTKMDPDRLRRKLGLSAMAWPETLGRLRQLAV